jgi:hypothetical protein
MLQGKMLGLRDIPAYQMVSLQRQDMSYHIAFFGIVALLIVYVYRDFLMGIAGFLGSCIVIVDIIFVAAFALDALFSCARVLKARKMGVKLKGYAVFSDYGLGR